jgi:hypothetical protein
VSINTEKTPLRHSQTDRTNQRDALSHKRQSRLRFSLLSSVPKEARWFVRILYGEARSLVSRMRVLRDRNNHRFASLDALPLGPLFEENALTGHLEPCRETFARNESIEYMLATFPWASAGDALLFLHGWETGRSFSLDSVCNKCKGTEQPSAASASTTKVDSISDEGQRNSGLESALSGARTEADHRRNWLSKVAANLFLPHRLLGLRAMWREICSLPSRIAISRRNNWFRYGISLDCSVRGLFLPSYLRGKYRDARIRGIQILRTIHPAATPVDLHILLSAIDPQIFLEYRDTEVGSSEIPSLETLRNRAKTAKRKAES